LKLFNFALSSQVPSRQRVKNPGGDLTKGRMGNSGGSMRCCPALEGRAITQDEFEEAFSVEKLVDGELRQVPRVGARETAITVYISVAQRVYFESVWARAIKAKASPNYVSSDAKGPLTTDGGVTYQVCVGLPDAIHKINALLPTLADGAVGAAVVFASNDAEALSGHLQARGFDCNVVTADKGEAMVAAFRKEAAPAVSGSVLWSMKLGYCWSAKTGTMQGGEVVHHCFSIGAEDLEVVLTHHHFWTLAMALGVDLEGPAPGPEIMEGGPEKNTLFEKIATSETVPDEVLTMFGRDPGMHSMFKTARLEKRVYPIRVRASTSLRKLFDRPYNLLTGVILGDDENYSAPPACAATMVARGLLTKHYAESVAKLCKISRYN